MVEEPPMDPFDSFPQLRSLDLDDPTNGEDMFAHPTPVPFVGTGTKRGVQEDGPGDPTNKRQKTNKSRKVKKPEKTDRQQKADPPQRTKKPEKTDRQEKADTPQKLDDSEEDAAADGEYWPKFAFIGKIPSRLLTGTSANIATTVELLGYRQFVPSAPQA
jgi:hypothetical protein